MKRSARLIISYHCLRDCAGCCNKGWKYEPPIPITDLRQIADYNEVMITGGEPSLFPDATIRIAQQLKAFSKAKIYVYTAMVYHFIEISNWTDGITLTLHEEIDKEYFLLFYYRREEWFRRLAIFHPHKTYRLNTFVDLHLKYPPFKIKRTEWIKDCPLPKNETLFRLEPLLTPKFDRFSHWLFKE